jgi:hypothetical protein
MTGKDLDAVLRLQEKLVETLLQFQITVLGLRLEVSALKNLVLADDDLKARFAAQLVVESNIAEPAIQQLRVALQRQLRDVQALRKAPSKLIH